MEKKAVVHHLVFSGGGTRGLAYAAAYKELCERCDVQLRSVAGTSIGALVSVCLAVGYTGSELQALVRRLNLSDLTNISLFSMFQRWGLDDGQKLRDFVDETLASKTGQRGMRLRDLPIPTTIVSTDLNAGKAVYLTPTTFPSLKVSEAVHMSMALPPLFAPIQKGGKTFIDGGLCDNFPIQRSPDPATTVGFQLHWKNAFELTSMDTYFSRVVYVGLYRLSQQKTKETAARVITIDGGDVATLNMNVPQSVKSTLFQNARSAVRAWEEKAREEEK